jgi:hypothetical protein
MNKASVSTKSAVQVRLAVGVQDLCTLVAECTASTSPHCRVGEVQSGNQQHDLLSVVTLRTVRTTRDRSSTVQQ